MTVEPDDDDAHTYQVGVMAERLDEYLDVLEEERETVEAILADLEDAPDDECLTREEYRQVFPATMPTEEWGGFGG
ncbi:ORF 5 [Haloarcula hispanica virus SH1]|uniref:ORF 5 n=1 Tax=Haloarcula hispanica SH1 virus TaxID=326574 RepID=Q4KPI2_9VIRU|nr:ORF 5 [Haloarcula hispanica virus SH1]AAY24931.1 ORF 5 [Haloarcula hispanica virus SH1]